MNKIYALACRDGKSQWTFPTPCISFEKIIIEFFPKRQNPCPAHARQGRISFLNSAVPPTFGLVPAALFIQFDNSATSFDICADFSVTPLPVTNGLQNTSDRIIIANL
ncbi:hypothetical protein C0J00_02170 [Streptococcus pluranimalium]|uniref:Uncharacterized protein n=1 Tax=Streptococcus pluranimalium TaxID=82348 RepID=A0A2L0D2H8_9STRE|nr:hypothetical protein C0J00_02170 [Streptococcus pluranimalium]